MLRSYSTYLILVFLLPLVAHGQDASMGWGIKGGLNMSGVQTDNTIVVSNDSKLGWQAGVFTNSISSGWGYWAEASLMTLGSSQVYGDESQKNTIGYLSLPLGLQYRTESNFGFLLGGYASFRLWAQRKSSKAGVADSKADISDNVAFVDYGGWISINYKHKKFVFDFRYLQGISNINTNSAVSGRAVNTSGQFSVAYYLR